MFHVKLFIRIIHIASILFDVSRETGFFFCINSIMGFTRIYIDWSVISSILLIWFTISLYLLIFVSRETFFAFFYDFVIAFLPYIRFLFKTYIPDI